MAGRVRKRGAAPRKAAAADSFSALRWLGIGWVSGLFTALVIALSMRGDTESPNAPPANPERETQQERPAPRFDFDFYKTLPGEAPATPAAPPADAAADPRTTEVEAEPGAERSDPELEPAPVPPAPSETRFMLQAGSFRLEADADRRRAELLLLGLTPEVSAVDTDNGRWFRVYLGPFRDRAELDRVRAMAAQQNIETLPMQADQR